MLSWEASDIEVIDGLEHRVTDSKCAHTFERQQLLLPRLIPKKSSKSFKNSVTAVLESSCTRGKQ